MKPYFKIILICILIFSLVVYIAKKSIDHTFCKVQETEVLQTSSLDILQKIKEV